MNPFAAIPHLPLAALLWRGQLDAWLSGLVLVLGAVALRWSYRRLRARLGLARTLLLLGPKLLVALLLVLALFEPVWSRLLRDPAKSRLVVLLDVSASMQVADDGHQPRAARARRLLERIRDSLPGEVGLETISFGAQLQPGLENAAPASTNAALPPATDLAGSLLALADRADLGTAAGVLVLTDGGDEKVQPARMPGAPTSFIGIGHDPSQWDDLAITELQAPPTVEKEIEFEITADLQARARSPEFAGRLASVTVQLHRLETGAWQTVSEQVVDLSRLRARVRFKTRSLETGLERYRVSLAAVPGELAVLNNTRTVMVDVRKKSVHVLYFTRELGIDFKMLRAELARDPGISFTALFRTLSERFTIQGDRLAGDDELEAGFPTSVATLKLYDCIILGSFPATDWTEPQLQALARYVEEGGALVLLGGEKSFGRGGYAGSLLAPLVPWPISATEPALASGAFPVSVPAAASSHPILAGVRESLERTAASLESLNAVTATKPGAEVLLNAGLGARSQPVVAMQSYGQGKVLALASNTLWKWATGTEELKSAHGLFWRQAVRQLTGKTEGGRLLAVRWDKDNYRPGESASAEVRLAGQQTSHQARLAPTLTFAGQGSDLAVEPVPGQPGCFTVKMQFRQRGEHVFRLVAYHQDDLVEVYEKILPIAPLLAEGAHLELDENFLRALAAQGGGTYTREQDTDQLLQQLARGAAQKQILVEKPIAETGPWFVLAVLALLALEWILRRRANLF